MELSKPRQSHESYEAKRLSAMKIFKSKQLEYSHWSFIFMVDNFVDRRSKHISNEMHMEEKISTIASIELEHS